MSRDTYDPDRTEGPPPVGHPGCLEGTRVLDLSSVIMGPYATQILGDLGAEVICVETAHGDTNRFMGPGPHPQFSGMSLNLLRNKRGLSIDLKQDRGREAFLRVAGTCDVLVTNLRPKPLQRLGLTYNDLVQVRPDIVYCQANGFPSDAPQANDPAYDDIIQAATGVADAMRIAYGEPWLMPTIFADKVCGLAIVYAVLAAMVSRERTGEGQFVEVPMVDVMRSFMFVEHGAGAIGALGRGPAGYARVLTANRKAQRTADGWIAILPYVPEHFDALFRAGGEDQLVGDARYTSGRPQMIANSDSLYADLHRIVPRQTTDWWITFCQKHRIPVSRVGLLDEMVASLPDVVHPVAGPYKEIPTPARFAGTPATIRRTAPTVGQHSTAILTEVGLSKLEIDALVRDGVVLPGGEGDQT